MAPPFSRMLSPHVVRLHSLIRVPSLIGETVKWFRRPRLGIGSIFDKGTFSDLGDS